MQIINIHSIVVSVNKIYSKIDVNINKIYLKCVCKHEEKYSFKYYNSLF